MKRRQRAKAKSSGGPTEAQRLRKALDHLSTYVYMKDPQSRYVYANQPTLELFGCSAEELVGCDDGGFFPPDTVKRLREVDARVFEGEQTTEEIVVVDAAGGRRVYWENKTPIYAEDGSETVWGLLGISTDITDRKQAEAALRDRELRWKFAIEGAGDGLWDWNTTNNKVFYSPRWKATLGFTDSEIGDDFDEWEKRVHPEDKQAALAAVQAHFTGLTAQYVSEHRLRCKDGSWKCILARGLVVSRDADGKPLRMIGTHTDITERKQMERKLGDALVEAQRFRNALDTVPAQVYMKDHQLRYVYANRPTLNAFGCSAEELIGVDDTQFFPPDTADRIRGIDVRVLRGEQTAETIEVADPDGCRRVYWEVKTPVYAEAQRKTIWGVLGISTDITERERAAVALANAAEALERTGEMAKVGSWTLDVASSRMSLSQEAYRISEIDPLVELTVNTAMGMISPQARPVIQAALEAVISNGTPFDLEVPMTTAKGRPIWAQAQGAAVMEAGRAVAVRGAFHDITVRKEAEEALRASLRNQDALLREVHHRVKNNLQVVMSLLRLETRRSTNAETIAVLTDMQGRIGSMALLHETLYRSGTFAAVDLGSYIRQLITELFRSLTADPDAIRLDLDLGSVQVGMDRAVPCGLIVNELVTNCIEHGFPTGHTGAVRVALRAVDGGTRLRLQVNDTGIGLPADFAAKRDTSLGLTLVSDLARQLGGTLEIGPGPTAEFAITFPVDKPAPRVNRTDVAATVSNTDATLQRA